MKMHYTGPDGEPIVVDHQPIFVDEWTAAAENVVVGGLVVWPDGRFQVCLRADATRRVAKVIQASAETRLSRLFNPDGSEPDEWTVREDGGRGVLWDYVPDAPDPTDNGQRPNG